MDASIVRYLFFWMVTTTSTAQIQGYQYLVQHVSQKAIRRIPGEVWRPLANQHQSRIRQLLQPGLTHLHHELNTGLSRHRADNKNDPHHLLRTNGDNRESDQGWTALDPKNPIYNFLIEYYGLKGAKGPRRLARWSPSLDLLPLIDEWRDDDDRQTYAMEDAPGIMLQGATEIDLCGLLHLRGAIIQEDGVLYSPALFFGKGDPSRVEEASRAATAYLWYHQVLQQTLSAEPVFYCHGLHEWAMQYQPEGAPPPPSAKYQAHLPLRVSREVINAAVERKGIHCTHVDALRYFSPSAAPLNHHGAVLQRIDQLRLEQPGCVHAHMDLLKIALKLQPFGNSELLQLVLEVALQARRLDVAASPYDTSGYGLTAIPVETLEGREQYRQEQRKLMETAQGVRRQLLNDYEIFLRAAFDLDVLEKARRFPQAERFAQAEPGSLPWRKNLLE